MKKRIAVLANGWNCENISNFMIGLSEAIKKEYADFFLFLSYASYGYTPTAQKAEALIYELPDLKAFDIVIIFGPGLNFPEVIEKIQKLADESGVPVISIGIRHPGHYFIGADNYSGMKALADHMIEAHGVKDILFIAGSKENDDSNERLRAVKDSTREHGISFGEKNIIYSDWEQGKALNYIRTTYKTPADFPDAFMCANDQLAISVNQTMENYYHLNTNAVKITGFDYLDQSKTFYPSITTVDQRYDEIGRKTAQLIEDILKGKKVPHETVVECKWERGESCGCGYSRRAMLYRRGYIRKMQWESRLTMNREGRLFVIERSITQGQNYTSVRKNVQDLLYNSMGSEGDTFYLMFSPLLETIGEKEESMLPQYMLDKDYLVVGAKKDRKPVEAERVDRCEIVPGDTGEGENRIYLVTILRNDELICGYMIQGSSAYDIRRNNLYDFQGRIDRAFFTYIRNLQLNALNKKLADLMEQDALTHVKNRTAYNKYVKSFNLKVSEGQIKQYAVGYFDINNLKIVNDKYGHEAGDAYIKNSCKLICDTFKHSPVFRIGGDEFLCIIYENDFQNREELLEKMKQEMKLRESDPEKYSPSFRVSIAAGIAVFDSDQDNDLMSVVNRADVLMYEDKFRMKKGDVR